MSGLVFRSLCSRCGGSNDAQILPVRRHSEHCIQNGVQWRRFANSDTMDSQLEKVLFIHQAFARLLLLLFWFPALKALLPLKCSILWKSFKSPKKKCNSTKGSLMQWTNFPVFNGLFSMSSFHMLALKIHVSTQCKEILERLEGYKLEERGYVHMKVHNVNWTQFSSFVASKTRQTDVGTEGWGTFVARPNWCIRSTS